MGEALFCLKKVCPHPPPPPPPPHLLPFFSGIAQEDARTHAKLPILVNSTNYAKTSHLIWRMLAKLSYSVTKTFIIKY